MPSEHWTTFCHIQQTRLQMTSGNWWLTLTYFATFFCKIFRIFKPSDALKMFSTIEADFQTDWNKCPENGGKSSRGLPEITKVNLWNSKRQKKIWYKFSVKGRRWWSSIVFFKKPTIDFFGWVELIEIDGGQITGHQEEITRWGKDKVSWWKMDEYRN